MSQVAKVVWEDIGTIGIGNSTNGSVVGGVSDSVRKSFGLPNASSFSKCVFKLKMRIPKRPVSLCLSLFSPLPRHHHLSSSYSSSTFLRILHFHSKTVLSSGVPDHSSYSRKLLRPQGWCSFACNSV